MTYEETLTDSGWQFARNCGCGGSPTKSYINNNMPGFEVWIKPNRKTYEFKKHGHTMKGGPLSDLDNAIKEYFK